MTLQNPQHYSLEYILKSVEQGFNRYLAKIGSGSEYTFELIGNRIEIKGKINKEVQIMINRYNDYEVELMTYTTNLNTNLRHQLAIYLEAIGVKEL